MRIAIYYAHTHVYIELASVRKQLKVLQKVAFHVDDSDDDDDDDGDSGLAVHSHGHGHVDAIDTTRGTSRIPGPGPDQSLRRMETLLAGKIKVIIVFIAWVCLRRLFSGGLLSSPRTAVLLFFYFFFLCCRLHGLYGVNSMAHYLVARSVACYADQNQDARRLKIK